MLKILEPNCKTTSQGSCKAPLKRARGFLWSRRVMDISLTIVRAIVYLVILWVRCFRLRQKNKKLSNRLPAKKAQNACRAVVRPSTPQAANLPTVASHRIDPTEEYIKNLEQNKTKIWHPCQKKLGWPANPTFFSKNTKKRPCFESGFAKKRTPKRKSRYKKKKHEKLNYGRHPVEWIKSFSATKYKNR